MGVVGSVGMEKSRCGGRVFLCSLDGELCRICAFGRGFVEPGVKLAESEFALLLVPFFAVANFLFERREKIEGDVGGLESFGIGLRDVVNERTECRGAGRGNGIGSGGERGGVHAGHQADRDGFDVPFDSADLAGKENAGMRFHLERGIE